MASDFDVAAEDAEDAAAFETQAREAFTQEKLPRALVLIDRAVELEPTSFDAWSFRAKILVALDRGDEALVSIDRALDLEPSDYDALAEKSGILSMLSQDLEGGLKYAKLAYDAMVASVPPERRSDPDGDDFWAVENVYDNLYYALYRLGQLDEAAKVRAEAASYGHDFAEGIDDGEA
jgi:tetratricopeptide (TPR) repeat protein